MPKGRVRRNGLQRTLKPLALASLSLLPAGFALATTDITASQTTPVLTSKTGDVDIQSNGTVNPSGGAAVTVDSSNSVSLEGSITINNANNATGILANGGETGSITVDGGTINITDSPAATTIPLTNGTNRYGIWINGTTPFTGSINESSGTIEVRGNNSAGILVGSGGMTGNISIVGTLAVTGNDSYGIQTQGSIGGVTISGTVAVTGQGSSALLLGGPLTGALEIDSGVRETAYFTAGQVVTGRPATLTGLTANDLLQGGAAVVVQNSVAGGILIGNAGTVSSFGSAPSLEIAPTGGSATIGVYEPGTFTNGLLVEGLVRGNGIYDGFSATGLQIGGAGGAVTITGGARVTSTGSVTARAFAANATAISIGSGANLPSLDVFGKVDATVLFGANANAATGGTATAILDNGGALSAITNTGQIIATTASGSAIALDLRGDTTAVTVTQSASTPASTTPPSITGSIMFGSAGGTLDLDAGKIAGDVSYGTGGGALNIAGGAVLDGALSTSGGTISVNVQNGQLNLAGTSSTSVSTLTVGSSGQINFAADPTTGQNAKIDALQAVIVAEGAKVGLDLTSRLITPETFTLIQTNPGGLSGQALSIGDVSYFYVANLATNNTDGTVSIGLRDRSFAESGLVGNAAAYNAIANVVGNDEQVFQAFNNAATKQSFSHLYTQMLPFYTGGLFEVLQSGANEITRAQQNAPIALAGDHSGAWVQALGFGAEMGASENPGYYGGGLGLAFGWESPASSISTLGYTFSYMRGSITQTGQGSDSQETGSTYSGGVYWREVDGPFHLNASANIGVGQFNSVRNFEGADSTDTPFTRAASANWTGALGNVHVGLGYEIPLDDHFYIRPETAADYFVLYEGTHKEHNGGNAFDLNIASTLGKQGSVEGDLTLGAHYNDESFIWKPELTVGWKQAFGGPDDTMAQFSMGSAFTLSPKAQEGGALARLGIHGGDKYTDIAFEAGGEDRGPVKSFDGQLVAKMKF
jgi:hypothetical protein